MVRCRWLRTIPLPQFTTMIKKSLKMMKKTRKERKTFTASPPWRGLPFLAACSRLGSPADSQDRDPARCSGRPTGSRHPRLRTRRIGRCRLHRMGKRFRASPPPIANTVPVCLDDCAVPVPCFCVVVSVGHGFASILAIKARAVADAERMSATC